MVRRRIQTTSFLIILGIVASAYGGVDFPDPTGGWTYIYTGDDATAGADFDALDGTWDHDNGSDQWDGSVIGTGSPGGVNAMTEGDVSFLRLQETGDPRDFDMDDPTNRKILFGHSVTNDIGDVGETWLDDGVTISFRARIATTPPLDDVHPDGGGAPAPGRPGAPATCPMTGAKAPSGSASRTTTKSSPLPWRSLRTTTTSRAMLWS